MTETEVSFEAIKSIYHQLRLDYKKICAQEFGKPSDKIDKHGNPITERRLWAQTALKDLNHTYDYACFLSKSDGAKLFAEGLDQDVELDNIYQSLLNCKIYIGKL
jgi:hypothetical protein